MNKVTSIDLLESFTSVDSWKFVPNEPTSPGEKDRIKEKICQLIAEKNAALVAHHYVNPDVQDIAEATGGLVGDSMEMARFGRDSTASMLVVAGVFSMGETAKILSPGKKVLMPELAATCSLEMNCKPDDFAQFVKDHPDREVVVYGNTLAGVKAHAHWVVTSATAVDVVVHLRDQGKKIIWAPDKNLGQYIQETTGADMLMWDASCIVHDEFKALELSQMIEEHPGALVLVHPESPKDVIALADVVGSTSKLLAAARDMPASEFIVATDNAMMHKLRQQNPGKVFHEAPTAGRSATCKSCAHCPWMSMNELTNLLAVLEKEHNEIVVSSELASRAREPILRTLTFAQNPERLAQLGDGMGPA